MIPTQDMRNHKEFMSTPKPLPIREKDLTRRGCIGVSSGGRQKLI